MGILIENAIGCRVIPLVLVRSILLDKTVDLTTGMHYSRRPAGNGNVGTRGGAVVAVVDPAFS